MHAIDETIFFVCLRLQMSVGGPLNKVSHLKEALASVKVVLSKPLACLKHREATIRALLVCRLGLQCDTILYSYSFVCGRIAIGLKSI